MQEYTEWRLVGSAVPAGGLEDMRFPYFGDFEIKKNPAKWGWIMKTQQQNLKITGKTMAK